jgi:dihydrolipoamide dehydrogenase
LQKELTVWKKLQVYMEPIDYGNVPGCTYATPEIAQSLTENKLKKRIRIKNW